MRPNSIIQLKGIPSRSFQGRGSPIDRQGQHIAAQAVKQEKRKINLTKIGGSKSSAARLKQNMENQYEKSI
jgi:hypothetical protein